MNFVFVLWDERDGYDVGHFYKDEDSANFALKIKYTPFWIDSQKAKVEKVDVISFGN